MPYGHVIKCLFWKCVEVALTYRHSVKCLCWKCAEVALTYRHFVNVYVLELCVVKPNYDINYSEIVVSLFPQHTQSSVLKLLRKFCDFSVLCDLLY